MPSMYFSSIADKVKKYNREKQEKEDEINKKRAMDIFKNIPSFIEKSHKDGCEKYSIECPEECIVRGTAFCLKRKFKGYIRELICMLRNEGVEMEMKMAHEKYWIEIPISQFE